MGSAAPAEPIPQSAPDPLEPGSSTDSHAFSAWVFDIFYEPFFQSRLLAAMARYGFAR
jgi:hypothetical protein